MNATIVLAARIERHEIHQAVCRSRKQGLVCSTCTDFAESAARASRVLAAQLAEAA